MRVAGFIPCTRLRPIIEERWLRHERTLEELSRLCGGSPTSRTLRALMNDERPTVRFDVADRLLLALDADLLWYLDPSDGGLSDLYDGVGLDEQEPYAPRNENAPAARERSGARPQGGSLEASRR